MKMLNIQKQIET